MSFELFCAVLLGLFIPLSWLTFNLGWIEKIRQTLKNRIHDPDAILVPSLCVIVGPFFSVILTVRELPDVIKLLIPVLTFIAGQWMVEQRSDKEKKKTLQLMKDEIERNLDFLQINPISDLQNQALPPTPEFPKYLPLTRYKNDYLKLAKQVCYTSPDAIDKLERAISCIDKSNQCMRTKDTLNQFLMNSQLQESKVPTNVQMSIQTNNRNLAQLSSQLESHLRDILGLDA